MDSRGYRFFSFISFFPTGRFDLSTTQSFLNAALVYPVQKILTFIVQRLFGFSKKSLTV